MDAEFLVRRSKKISLTALIDVVFILLMFFMLTSTFSQWKSLSLPAAKASSESSDEAPALILVYGNRDIRVLNDNLSPVLNNIDEVLTIVGKKAIVISAEQDAQIQSILNIVDELTARERAFTLGQPFANPELSE